MKRISTRNSTSEDGWDF